MRKMLLGAIAIAAVLSSPARSADMPLKVPPVAAPSYNWTGCYLGAGGGYGMFNQENRLVTDPIFGPSIVETGKVTSGGRGWFGTVGGGCDYQISERWVIGAFADYDFSDIHGQLALPNSPFTGTEKERSAWAVGGRIGYLITPSVLTYFSGGFTQARFSNTALVFVDTGLPRNAHLQGRTFDGWFVGGGYEYNLGGILGWFPNLFWKTEYRFAEYDREFLAGINDVTGVHFTDGVDTRKFVQTVRTELVWRFNWGGPVRAAY
jgi:outer membrane immunogenic protein